MHKRLWGSISRRASDERSDKSIPNGDSPEASVARAVRLFCESGGSNNSGEEVLHLPTIVEAAESSPAAATQAAITIRKFLSSKNFFRAYVQYNAVMLVRILADNPGKNFTKNIDSKFINTAKELLRDGRDTSVQQILRETLDNFERARPNDETLTGIIEMWRKQKTNTSKHANMVQPIPRNFTPQPYNPDQQNYFARSHKSKGLPPPAELSQRVEEAKTSAKLLSQVVQSTPSSEILGNELIKEFADRCQSASRSMQSYIHSDSPAPDEDTLLTLIETNDQLATAMSKHQRAVLHARRVTGAISPSPQAQHGGPFEAPSPGPPPQQSNGFQHPSASGSGGYTPPAGPPPNHRQPAEQMNPFADHNQVDGPPPGNLQEPLVPQNYGLPPERVVVPSGSVGPAQPQTTKPRYRF